MTTATTTPTERSISTEVRVDRTPKRIRVYRGGAPIADSIDASLGYASGRHPDYLIPAGDVGWTHLVLDDAGHSAFGSFRAIRSADGGRELGRRYDAGPGAGSVTFEFGLMDAWFEEDEQIWFHPRDPYRRVDVLESSRSVEVSVDGRPVARTERPRLVVETGLPERWYIPRVDVDWSQLATSATTSGCQYKGVANWWHARRDEADQLADVVWGYERPVPEASKLAGLVAFYAEHAAVETYVDGRRQPKPVLDGTALNPSFGLVNQVV